MATSKAQSVTYGRRNLASAELATTHTSALHISLATCGVSFRNSAVKMFDGYQCANDG